MGLRLESGGGRNLGRSPPHAATAWGPSAMRRNVSDSPLECSASRPHVALRNPNPVPLSRWNFEKQASLTLHRKGHLSSRTRHTAPCIRWDCHLGGGLCLWFLGDGLGDGRDLTGSRGRLGGRSSLLGLRGVEYGLGLGGTLCPGHDGGHGGLLGDRGLFGGRRLGRRDLGRRRRANAPAEKSQIRILHRLIDRSSGPAICGRHGVSAPAASRRRERHMPPSQCSVRVVANIFLGIGIFESNGGGLPRPFLQPGFGARLSCI